MIPSTLTRIWSVVASFISKTTLPTIISKEPFYNHPCNQRHGAQTAYRHKTQGDTALALETPETQTHPQLVEETQTWGCTKLVLGITKENR